MPALAGGRRHTSIVEALGSIVRVLVIPAALSLSSTGRSSPARLARCLNLSVSAVAAGDYGVA